MTVNSPGPDTEIVVGQCGIDWTGATASLQYHGLGDDPAAYRVTIQNGRLRIEDEHWPGV